MVDFAKLGEKMKAHRAKLRQWPILGHATERLTQVERGLDVELGRTHKPVCCLRCLLPWAEADWCDCGMWGERPTWW